MQGHITQQFLWIDDERNHHKRRQAVLKEVRTFLGKQNGQQQQQQQKKNRIIVFTNTKDEAERIGQVLKQEKIAGGIRVVTGDKVQ